MNLDFDFKTKMRFSLQILKRQGCLPISLILFCFSFNMMFSIFKSLQQRTLHVEEQVFNTIQYLYTVVQINK